MIIKMVDHEIVTSFPTVVKENSELKNRLTSLTNGLEVWLTLILLKISFVFLATYVFWVNYNNGTKQTLV